MKIVVLLSLFLKNTVKILKENAYLYTTINVNYIKLHVPDVCLH